MVLGLNPEGYVTLGGLNKNGPSSTFFKGAFFKMLSHQGVELSERIRWCGFVGGTVSLG